MTRPKVKKSSFLQRVSNRVRTFYHTVKDGMKNTIHYAGIVISIPSMFHYPVTPMLLAPFTLIITTAVTVVGTIYNLVKGVVRAVTRKPIYEMSDQEIISKLQLLENNPEKYSIFLRSVIEDYRNKKTSFASHESKRLVDQLILIAREKGLQVNAELYCHYIKGTGNIEINTAYIHRFLLENKGSNQGSRLFNILYKKLDSLDLMESAERAEIRKNARILNQIAKAKNLDISIFKHLAGKICSNDATKSVNPSEAQNLAYKYFKRPMDE